MVQPMETTFVVRYRPLPEPVAAVMAAPWLFVNDRHAEKWDQAVAWAREMVAAGKIDQIMRVS